MYDFKPLSPQDFELFVRDLFEAAFGWRLKAFAAGPDGGVDLKVGSGKGKIVVQCKHYAGSTPAQLQRSLVSDKPKMDKEKPGRYLVATSRALSKTQHDTVASAVSPPLLSPDDLLNQHDLNALLGQHPEVERRHFKLWLASSEVLSSIVNSGIWSRSEALLEDIQSRVQLYVPHEGYSRARDILDKQRVVVIAGSPGVGKSMLAEMLLLTHWKEDWQVVQVGADIDEAWSAWKPKGRQIFLYDDFLGQTNSGERLSKNEDASIAKFAHLVSTKPDKRFVLTTRTQVLRQAQDSREPLRRAAFDLKTCVVKLADYHRLDRARMVYNHLYFSNLPREVVRGYASGEAFWDAIDHQNYSPRIIEQVLRRPHATSAGLTTELAQALDHPVELWGPSFEHGLSELARELLLTLVTFPPEGVSRTELLSSCALKTQSLPVNQAFRALEGTWLRLSGSGSEITVAFADPSCRDYVLAYIDGDPEEAKRLLLDAQTPDQAVLLLRYALSTTHRGRRVVPMHPGLRTAVAESASAVILHVDRLYADAVQTGKDYRKLELLLSAVLSASNLLGAVGEDWLETRTREFSQMELPHWHEYSVLAELAIHMSQRHAITPPNQTRRLELAETTARLVHVMAEEAQREDEFQIYRRVTHNSITSALIDEETEDIFVEQATDYVRNALGELTSEYDDPDDMRNRLSELRDVARDYCPDSWLDGDFATAAQNIDEHESSEPEEDMSPTISRQAFSGSTVRSSSSLPEDKKGREDGQIRALFRHLS